MTGWLACLRISWRGHATLPQFPDEGYDEHMFAIPKKGEGKRMRAGAFDEETGSLKKIVCT